jgi:signal transduction histidine kinase
MPDSRPGASDAAGSASTPHERFRLIARVGHLVAGNLQLDELLERAADAIHTILGYENVAIPLVDPADPRSMVLTAFGGAYKHSIGGSHRITLGTGLMGVAAATRETVLVNDVTADPRYTPTPGGVPACAELAVPIVLGDRVLGVLNVESNRTLTAEDVDGLQIVADQLAVAIDNARLHEAAQRVAVLEERQRLARELHDSVTQQLFSAILVAQTIGESYALDRDEGERRCAALLKLSRGALSEMRALLAELSPPPITAGGHDSPRDDVEVSLVRREGLPAALRAHARAAEMTGMRISVDCHEWPRQDDAFEEDLYRIAREALHNVVKHAGASEVEVQLTARGGLALLTVRDDGRGFDTQSQGVRAQGIGEGIGMLSMRQRALGLGGRLLVDSVPGRGTIVEAHVPIRAGLTS